MRSLLNKRPMNAPATAGSAAMRRMEPNEPFRFAARPMKVRQGTTTVKAASTLIQVIALSACFAVSTSGEFKMSGVRRAIQTMASSQIAIPAEPAAAEGASFAV